MKEPIPKHEKIRFRRGDVTGLHAYPSAGMETLPAVPIRVLRRIARAVKWIGLALIGFVALAAAALAVIPSTGIESEWLRGQAERAVTRLAGADADVRIGHATLALDARHFLAIGIGDLSVGAKGGSTPVAQAGRLGLGIRFWPLLSGNVEIGSAALTDAQIAIPNGAAVRGGEGDIMSDDGLIVPDRLLDAVFAGLENLIRQVGPSGVETVRLRNVELTAGAGSTPLPLTIVDARLDYDGEDGVGLRGEIAAFDHVTEITGEAHAAVAGGEPTRFQLEARVAESGKTYEIGGTDPDNRGSVRPGEIAVQVTGREASDSGPAEIALSASVEPSAVTVGPSEEFQANAGLSARLTRGAGSLSIERLDIEAARSSFSFSGLVAPQPATDEAASDPNYAFRLIGPEINVAPRESPEPALAAIARVGGWIALDGRRIVANEISVATGQGEVIGSGTVEFAAGKTPGVSLAIAVARMPVSHAKNLWPFFSAPAAREWVLANVFGGTIENSRLLITVAPGRIGDGVPLTETEASGHFEVSNARFDVAGTIPPIRDAAGAVDFAGTNVDISLKSGTVFTESGRTLDASNGTLIIKDAHNKPVIGEVDVEIDGSAAAVTEVAGYDPINLSKYLPISPDGISGMAKGRVLASIPLQDDIAPDDLDWHLELAYEGLSLAEPYEGQRIEDATGTIVADPERADFAAEARLNGIRGELTLTEPLGADKSTRQRKARLYLEAGDSDKLFDGLSEMVSGPLTIDVEQIAPGREKVHADLTNAVLDIPWVGWSKEKGVAATADFMMERDGGTTRLEDFELSGEGFGGSGAITVDEQGLEKVRFGNIAFSSGDNIAMGIDRSGGNYAISVSGQSLDMRFLIREFASMQTAAAGSTGDDGGVSVTVDAEVSRVKGFNNESLVGAKLAFAGAASDLPGFRVSASTPSGDRVTIVDAAAGGTRKVEVKADDTGAVMRFLDIYDKLGGGRAALSLAGETGKPLKGQLEIRDFTIIDEARLQSMVSRAPPGAERSLNDAVRRDVDVSRARFDRGFASVEMGSGYLSVANGVVSGPSVGSTFEGTVFDGAGNMAINGTFLPAYGINRIFGEIPVLGQLLGNGRGGGLIGITYRLSGPIDEPNLEVNPLSIVAPGIFRSIFEYR